MPVIPPPLTRRYAASLIDGFFLMVVMILVAVLFQAEAMVPVRIAFFWLIFFGYEPLLTSQICTVGQRVMGIRVRRYGDTDARIGIFSSYVRFVVKIVLGAISFFTMGSTKQRRAIHDLAAGSVMTQVST
ncbi:MAG: hypothetical protein QOH06_5980 [Acidobacteriota bacterium]|nr:hypothetical protein [Acidobacteriota bacterium]